MASNALCMLLNEIFSHLDLPKGLGKSIKDSVPKKSESSPLLPRSSRAFLMFTRPEFLEKFVTLHVWRLSILFELARAIDNSIESSCYSHQTYRLEQRWIRMHFFLSLLFSPIVPSEGEALATGVSPPGAFGKSSENGQSSGKGTQELLGCSHLEL